MTSGTLAVWAGLLATTLAAGSCMLDRAGGLAPAPEDLATGGHGGTGGSGGVGAGSSSTSTAGAGGEGTGAQGVGDGGAGGQSAGGQGAGGCVPDCSGKSCGPDGCSASCGSCQPPDICQAGQCVCVPDCSGKSCGSDGCGASCGSCPGGSCISGQCCVPDCSGKQCGNDGCTPGGCGACGALEVCKIGQCACLYVPCNGTCCDWNEKCFSNVCVAIQQQ